MNRVPRLPSEGGGEAYPSLKVESPSMSVAARRVVEDASQSALEPGRPGASSVFAMRCITSAGTLARSPLSAFLLIARFYIKHRDDIAYSHVL